MSNNLPQRFTYPFCYTPHPLVVDAAKSLMTAIEADSEFKVLFSEGKMFGVLLVEDEYSPEGCSPLYAFSGNVSGRNLIEGFVPPVFDLLDKDGYFKKEEAHISDINIEITALSKDDPKVPELKQERKRLSLALQEWIFRQFVVFNANGGSRSIWDIFADRGIVPPSGTGECAAPKLLQYAYLHQLKPLAMGEFWYGASPASEVRTQGAFYPSCLGKCGPLLEYMMQGLDVEDNPLEHDFCSDTPKIIHKDEYIVVADKPSGMLSVPGKSDRESLQQWLSRTLQRVVYSCHRLDMDTSGLMIFAFDNKTKAAIEGEFARREVRKTYLARLLPSRRRIPERGTVTLPLMLDYYDRPRQKVDWREGKEAVTDFELVKMLPDGGAIVRFIPHTGRTHQLRVHSAHTLGLGRPIKGDRLYGDAGGGRLMLHAATIEFRHPVSGEMLIFSSENEATLTKID